MRGSLNTKTVNERIMTNLYIHHYVLRGIFLEKIKLSKSLARFPARVKSQLIPADTPEQSERCRQGSQPPDP